MHEAGRVAPERRRVTPVAAARLARGARSGGRRAARRAAAARSAGAASGSHRSATSSGATATTGCTKVTFSCDATAAGRCYSCNREAARRRNGRSRRYGGRRRRPRTSTRRLPRLPDDERLERTGQYAAGRSELGDDHCGDRRQRRARRLRLGPLRRLAHRHPVRRRARQDDAEVARHVRLLRRERQGAVPDPRERADRRRTGAPRLR